MDNLDKATKEARELREHGEAIGEAERWEMAVVDAGYAYVESVRHTADDRINRMWFGWPLRVAFIAGAKWQAECGRHCRI